MAGVIQITVTKTAVAGKGEVAKTYNTSFEGEMSDYKKLQEGIDTVVEGLVWEIKGQKKVTDPNPGENNAKQA